MVMMVIVLVRRGSARPFVTRDRKQCDETKNNPKQKQKRILKRHGPHKKNKNKNARAEKNENVKSKYRRSLILKIKTAAERATRAKTSTSGA